MGCARLGGRGITRRSTPTARLGQHIAGCSAYPARCPRRGAVSAAAWEHIDLDAAHLTVACTDSFTSKSGAERRIPLSARALTVLEELRARPNTTGLVFEAAGRAVDPNTCSDTVGRFADRAGVPSLTPHVLRHSCVTWLIERGVPVPVVQRFAGHADVSTTMRYCSVAADVYAGQIRDALR